MIKPRDYQEKGIERGIDFFESAGSQPPSVYVAPVAAGKSIIISGIASELTHPTLVMQPSKELLEQNYNKLVTFGGEASIYSASVGIKEIGHTTYATLGSIKNNAKDFKKIGVKNVIIDECFPYNTFISTKQGNKRIGSIHNLLKKGVKLEALSYNINEDKYEYKDIIRSKNNGLKHTYVVNFYGKRAISCTSNHKFLTVDKEWKKAEDLVDGDILLTSNPIKKNGYTIPYLSKDKLQIIFGSQLGDGYIEYKYQHQGRLKIIHGEKQKKYIEWKNKYLFNSNIEYIEKNGYSKKPAYRIQTTQFYFPYSYETIIDNLDLLGLSILWADDGNLSKFENSGTLYALCNNFKLIHKLNNKINELCNVKGKVIITIVNSNPLFYILYNKENIKRLTKQLAPYIPLCMKYKIPKEFWDEVETYKIDIKKDIPIVVFKELIYDKKEEVFDIEIQDNHNFIVCSQNNKYGEIAHNCHLGYSPKEDSMFRKFMDELNPDNVLGFTATPIRLKQYGDMSSSWSQLNMITRTNPKYFKEILDVVPISLMVERGFWSELLYEQYDFDESKLILNSTKAEFTEHSIKKAISEQGINNNIYLRIKTLLQEGRKNILVFTDSVETAIEMASKFPNISACVNGNTSKADRSKIIQQFKYGHIKIVFNFGTLTTGFDHEELDTIIIGRPTNSLALFYQMCIDENTEILTTKGFKNLYDISNEDIQDIYGYDINTKEIVPNKIIEIINRNQYDFEKLLSYSSNKIDFRVSEYHDMIYGNRRDTYYKKQAKHILSLKDTIRIPISGFEQQNDCGLSKEELLFLGLFLSDGSYNKSNNTVVISQSSSSNYVGYIEEVLKKCNFKYNTSIVKRKNLKYTEGINFTISYTTRDKQKRGWKDLEKFIDKNMGIPYNSMSRKDLSFIIKGLIIGDGCNKTNKKWNVLTHKIAVGLNKTFADNLQSLCIRRGYSCILKEYKNNESGWSLPNTYQIFALIKDTTYATLTGQRVKDNTVKDRPIRRSRLTIDTSKNNRLWCVETTQGNIITRRNGKVTIMGNCGRGTRIHVNKLNCLIIDFCNNVKRFGRLETLNFKNIDGFGWGMFSDDNLLTGIPMGTKVSLDDIMTKINKTKKDLVDYTLDFGKFKGRKLSTIPLGYRNWMLANIDGLVVKNIKKDVLKEQLLALLEEDAEVPLDETKLIIIDLNNIAYKLHKSRKLNKEGLKGYITKLSQSFNTSNVAVVNDSSKNSYWRKQIFPEYKENRKPQELDSSFFKGMTEINKEMNVIVRNGLEADDLIAIAVRNPNYKKVHVISSDGDFKQLAIFNRFSQHIPLTEKKLDISKKEAIGFLLTKILKGDSKDNIPKSHTHKRILTKDLEVLVNQVFQDILSYVKTNNIKQIENVNLRDIFWNNLSSKYEMNEKQFDLNFKLLNLIQKQYTV